MRQIKVRQRQLKTNPEEVKNDEKNCSDIVGFRVGFCWVDR
jgi:hypothetical protein